MQFELVSVPGVRGSVADVTLDTRAMAGPKTPVASADVRESRRALRRRREPRLRDHRDAESVRVSSDYKLVAMRRGVKVVAALVAALCLAPAAGALAAVPAND